jgi:membrane protein
VKTHSTYTVYKRIANLILILIGVAISINLWWVNQKQTETWYGIQAQQLGRSISQQKALALTQSVREKDMESLKEALEQLISDNHVIAAAVYDFRGRPLARAGSELSQLESIRLNAQHNLTFVADIVDATTQETETNSSLEIAAPVVGYLKVQLATDAVMAHHDKFQSQLNNQRIVFMLLAALGALYVTRAFYKMRFKFQRQLRAKARLLGKR